MNMQTPKVPENQENPVNLTQPEKQKNPQLPSEEDKEIFDSGDLHKDQKSNDLCKEGSRVIRNNHHDVNAVLSKELADPNNSVQKSKAGTQQNSPENPVRPNGHQPRPLEKSDAKEVEKHERKSKRIRGAKKTERMREYETQMLQKKYRSKEFFGTSSAVPSQNTSSNKERHVYVPRRPRRKSIRQREIKTIKQQNLPAEEKVVVEKKKRGRKPKNRDNAVKKEQPPKSRTHSEVNSNLNSTPNSITIPTSKLRKRKAIQEEEKEKPHISVSHNSSKHVTEKASTPESFSGASHKRRRTKMEHMNQNYIKNSNQNYYYQNGEKVVPQNFQKNDHYQNNHARNEYYQQHMNKRDQKYRRKAYEAYQMYNREPYQWPRYEPPQCDFRANLKLLPFVLQLDDCSLHLISDREIQYLNQTRNLQNSLTKFAYQNGGYSAIPSPNQIPQDEYSFMMVKMKRSYPQPHDNQYLYREEYPTHSRPSFPYQYEREQMQYQNPYHGKTKGSERAHEGMQAHFEN